MSRVLLVDDDLTACDTLGRYLCLEGFDVLTALSGNEGLTLARTAAPDVIVLDDRLPGGPCGRDVLRALREERCPVPVIMISGCGAAETGFEACRLGAVGFLTKPVLADDLVAAVNLALAQGSTSSPLTAAADGTARPRVSPGDDDSGAIAQELDDAAGSLLGRS